MGLGQADGCLQVPPQAYPVAAPQMPSSHRDVKVAGDGRQTLTGGEHPLFQLESNGQTQIWEEGADVATQGRLRIDLKREALELQGIGGDMGAKAAVARLCRPHKALEPADCGRQSVPPVLGVREEHLSQASTLRGAFVGQVGNKEQWLGPGHARP